MFSSDRLAALRGLAVLLAAALLLALLAVACDGDGDEGEAPAAGETPAADETAAADETPTTDGDEEEDGDGGGDEGVGAGGDAFDDVPLPSGADETSDVTISGTDLPFFVPEESGVEAEAFGDVTMKEYDVDASPGDVIDFYKNNRGDWEEAFSLATDEGGLLIWTKDGGARAIWISVSEGFDTGTTTLAIIQGLTQ